MLITRVSVVKHLTLRFLNTLQPCPTKSQNVTQRTFVAHCTKMSYCQQLDNLPLAVGVSSGDTLYFSDVLVLNCGKETVEEAGGKVT